MMDLPVLKRRPYNDMGVILCFSNFFILDLYRCRQKLRSSQDEGKDELVSGSEERKRYF